MSEYYSEELTDVLNQIQELPDPAQAWVHNQLAEAYNLDETYLTEVIGQARDRGDDGFDEGDLPALFLTEDERLAQIRERIAAAIPAYQGSDGPREQQIMLGEEVLSPGGVRTVYEDRDTIHERGADADDQGRVLDASGQPITGRYGWVVDDESGELLFFPESEVTLVWADGRRATYTREDGVPLFRAARARGEAVTLEKIHHTTPGAGQPVTGAGLMTLDDGWIVDISDESGHYQPTADDQYRAITGLAEDGYALQRPVAAEDSPDGVAGHREAQVHLTGAGGGAGGRPTGKADWINELHDANPDVPTGGMDLSATQFLATEGNEVQARLKAGLNAEFERTHGAQLRAQADPDAPAPVPGAAQAAPGGADEYNYLPDPSQDAAQATQQPQPAAAVATGFYSEDAPVAREQVASPVAGPGYEYDADRGLYRQAETGHYYDEQGNLIYQWDPDQARYYDHSTGTWL